MKTTWTIMIHIGDDVYARHAQNSNRWSKRKSVDMNSGETEAFFEKFKFLCAIFFSLFLTLETKSLKIPYYLTNLHQQNKNLQKTLY